MASTGTIFLLGDRGVIPEPISKHVVSNPVSAAALTTYMQFLQGNVTDCLGVRLAYSERADFDVVRPGANVNVDRKAVFIVEDVNSGAILKPAISGPKLAIIVEENEGDRIDIDVVTAYAAALSDCTGRSLRGRYGYVIGKK